MSDEKLDLILNVVSDIKNRQEGLEKTVGEMNTRQTNLERTVGEMNTRQTSLEKTVGEMNFKIDNLSDRVDNLSADFTDFKKQAAESFAAVQNRFTVLEKQMTAIGVELKEELKAEIKAVGENIDRLEQEILFARADAVDNRVKVRELETRLSKLEIHVGLTT